MGASVGKRPGLRTAIDNEISISNPLLKESFEGYFPLGFDAWESFQAFVVELYSDLPDFNGIIIFQGSSVAGESYKLKEGSRSKIFDDGRVSDYDIAIVSGLLFEKAKSTPSIKVKDNTHTEPLKLNACIALGLEALYKNANARISTYSTMQRDVNFMIYDSEANAIQHTGPSLVCPEPSVWRMGEAVQMYNYMMGDVAFE
jgi:hypothetical protein